MRADDEQVGLHRTREVHEMHIHPPPTRLHTNLDALLTQDSGHLLAQITLQDLLHLQVVSIKVSGPRIPSR